MRARATMLWFVNTPDPAAALRAGEDVDQDVATDTLVARLYPDVDMAATDFRSLADSAGPEPGTVYVGRYRGVTVVCDARLAVPRPSRLPADLIGAMPAHDTYLIGMDPALGWGGFAHWRGSALRRSFSATHINILEDEGLPLVWERPFWAGEHPTRPNGEHPHPHWLPFDPMRFADEANLRWLGFRRHYAAGASVDLNAVKVRGYSRFVPDETPAAAPEVPAAAGDVTAATPVRRRKWLRRSSSTANSRA